MWDQLIGYYKVATPNNDNERNPCSCQTLYSTSFFFSSIYPRQSDNATEMQEN